MEYAGRCRGKGGRTGGAVGSGFDSALKVPADVSVAGGVDGGLGMPRCLLLQQSSGPPWDQRVWVCVPGLLENRCVGVDLLRQRMWGV